MASREMSRLNVSLTASIGNWEKNLEKAANKLVSFVGISKKTTDMLIGTLPKLTALFGGVGVAAGIKMAATRMDELAKASERLGISSKELAGLQHAAAMGGSSAEGMTNALEKLTVQSEAALSGNKKLEDTFRSVGVSMDDLRRKNVSDVMSQIADGMQRLSGPGERMATTLELFGKGQHAMATVLADGSAGLKAMADESDALGLSVSRLDGKKIQAMNDAVANVANVSSGIFNQLAARIAPIVTDIANGFVKWVKELGGAKVIADAIFNTMFTIAGKLGDLGFVLLSAFDVVKVSIYQIAKFAAPLFDLIDKADKEFNAKRQQREADHAARMEKNKTKAEEITAQIEGLRKLEEDSSNWFRQYESTRTSGERDAAIGSAEQWRESWLEMGRQVNDISERIRKESSESSKALMQDEINKRLSLMKQLNSNEMRDREEAGKKTAELDRINSGKIYADQREKLQEQLRLLHADITKENERAPGLKLFDPEKIKSDMDALTRGTVEDFWKRQSAERPSEILTRYKQFLDEKRRLDEENDAAIAAKEAEQAAIRRKKLEDDERSAEAARIARAQHNSSLAGILEQEELKRKEESNWAYTKSYLNSLNTQTAALAKHSKVMFNVNKGVSMANAVMNTAEGITKAYSYGWPLGPFLAGMVAAAGAAQIAVIAGTSYGQQSGSVSSAGTGSASGETAADQATSNIGGPRQQPQEIVIYGDTVSTDQLLRMTEQARERGVILGGFRRG